MINPKTILGEWVTTLRTLPNLVAAIGDGSRIQYYTENATVFGQQTENNIRLAILSMPPGSVLIAWQGIAVAVRSPSVRQLVMLYSEATGQKMPLSATTPYAGSLVEQGGNLYQQASYQDGQAHTYASNIPTLGGIASGTYPTPGGPNTSGGTGATYLSMNVSGSDAANFMTGQFVTPQFVTDQAMAAQYSSYGRTQQSANMQVPGLTVA